MFKLYARVPTTVLDCTYHPIPLGLENDTRVPLGWGMQTEIYTGYPWTDPGGAGCEVLQFSKNMPKNIPAIVQVRTQQRPSRDPTCTPF